MAIKSLQYDYMVSTINSTSHQSWAHAKDKIDVIAHFGNAG
jgi:hypothetical protein